MTSYIKKHLVLSTLLAIGISFFAFHGVYAQSYGGDDVCGSSTTTKCTLDNAKSMISNLVTKLVIPLTLAFLTLFIMYRIVAAYFSYVQGNAGAWKDARNKITNAVLGLIIIVLVFGGFYATLLGILGTQPWAVQLLKMISSAIVPHAYAQEGLPNPIGVTSLYDFLLAVVRLTVRWFIIPAILAMWVYTGFSFVLAQGKPEALSKAKKYLGWAVVATVLIMMTEGFLFALRGTVQNIIQPTSTSQTATTNTTNNSSVGTVDGRTAPTEGSEGSSCQDASGNFGRIVSGQCYTASGCTGKTDGNTCTIHSANGTCTTKNGTFECYAPTNASCKTVAGTFGQIGADGTTCYTSGTR